MINFLMALALIALVLARLPAAIRSRRARPAWLASAFGLLGLLSIGVLIPMPVTDALLGGTNVLFLLRTVFPVAAFWFFRDAVALQAGRSPRRGRTWLVLLAMTAAQATAFFLIPNRGTTDIEFVDNHMIYPAGFLWAVIYAGQIIWIAADVIRVLGRPRRNLFASFTLGSASVILGAIALIAHCGAILLRIVDPVSNDPAWILFNVFFYPGLLLIVVGFLAIAVMTGSRNAIWQRRSDRLHKTLATYGNASASDPFSASDALQSHDARDPVRTAYAATIALRNVQLLREHDFPAEHSKQLRDAEFALDAELHRRTT